MENIIATKIVPDKLFGAYGKPGKPASTELEEEIREIYRLKNIPYCSL